MTRSRQFKNRKGINGGCRSTGHARQTARKELMEEWWLMPRHLRAVFCEKGSLWGPLRAMSRHLIIKGTVMAGKRVPYGSLLREGVAK